jgi:peroxiredoxin
VELAIGNAVPEFRLPDTDGNLTPLDAKENAATIIVFTCNRCPYALGWHDRIQAVAKDYADRNVRVLQINSNALELSPADAPEEMASRVAAGHFAGPYLRDEDQEVARAWGATVTPHIFVLDGDGTLVYRGAPDSDHDDESLAARWLRDAVDDALAHRQVARPETEAKGCTVKYRA